MEPVEIFFKAFAWYRIISNRLIDEIPPEFMQQQISSRSLTPACQFVDLGDFHLRVCNLIEGHVEDIARPDPTTATPEEIKAYIARCQEILKKVLIAVPDKEHFTITWFDRMTFTFPEVMTFILAHEAMHHGELMSFIYNKNLPMTKAFTDTWGMC